MSVAIALFTRDLRVHDNPVLRAACHAATTVVPLFVLDKAILGAGDWLAGPVHRYEQAHDDLAADGTSRLSPYLHFGCVSPTELLHAIDRSTPGGEAFVRQLAWRDFHHQVLAARPDAATADYHTRHDRWRHDEKAASAWRAGQTGYPIVDAGMRQLQEEGWMHNRARLITASFLTKTLYLDWRIGARHFLDLLRQAERYDPSGAYVRRYLPELRDIPGPAVHQPWNLDPATRARLDYPDPIIDLRDGADHFRTARGKNRSPVGSGGKP